MSPSTAIPESPRAPQLEVDDDSQLPAGAFSPDDAIDEQIAELERFAMANERRERNETIRFWVLRGSAFLSAVLAGVLASLGFSRTTAFLAACSALFIAIDAARPSASQRNPYRRAIYDLRSLQGSVRLRWDKVRLAYPNPNGSKRVAHALAILDGIQAKRDEIGKYLGVAEASPTRGGVQ